MIDEPDRTTARTTAGSTPWLPMVSVAAIAAILSAAAAAGAVSLIDDDPGAASLADVGQEQSDIVPAQSAFVGGTDWNAVAGAVEDSVVSIETRSAQGGTGGSGVVLDDEGHVLTNNHVVEGAQDVEMTLHDGRILDGEVVGADATTDLAVVRVQDAPDDLSPATLGDSDAVGVGDPVLAVGSPLGLSGTATTGIVSALDRPVTASTEYGGDLVVSNSIQTDAPINPGNSGGPLFDAAGEVIGINSSILTTSVGESGSIGLGFAIPSALARNISDQLIDDGEAEHAFLGVSLSDGTATADGITRRGARVEDVVDGSPAAGAGIGEGDVIVAIGDDPVTGAASLTAFVRERTADEPVVLTVVSGGETDEVEVTLALRDESDG
ncbi:S1C family serine protease [Promicromonospora panici]|uniref:S1C family serine protease n=1 Tax=Promicromonospora panici TaxID=2219658 RepID=UPI001F5C795F|nr:trypsin-like peptidase domain-containing protein [Promicromonospora panici]